MFDIVIIGLCVAVGTNFKKAGQKGAGKYIGGAIAIWLGGLFIAGVVLSTTGIFELFLLFAAIAYIVPIILLISGLRKSNSLLEIRDIQNNIANSGNSQTTNIAKYTEKDNRGLRIASQAQSIAYWTVERLSKPQKAPFVYYIFKSDHDAKSAMLELSFIHEASDSKNLICDYMFHFGYYATTENNVPTGEYDAFVAGMDLSYSMYEEMHTAFRKHNGTMKNDLAPDRTAKTAPPKKGDKTKVKFVREQVSNGSTYVTYSAPSKADAVEFLATQTVTQQLYYVVVDTPEGSFGKDIQGFYQE